MMLALILAVSAAFAGDSILHDAQESKVITEEAHDVVSVEFSPDSSRILMVGRGHSAVWDADSGKALYRIEHPGGLKYPSCFSPDGKKIAISDNRGAVIRDVETGDFVAALWASGRPLDSLSFNRDGSRVMASGRDFPLSLWDAKTGKKEATLPMATWRADNASFSPDGTRVVVRDLYNKALIWEARTGKFLHELRFDPPYHEKWMHYMRSASYSRDGSTILTHSGCMAPLASHCKDFLTLWDAHTAQPIRNITMSFDNGYNRVHSAVLSPDNLKIATAGGDGDVVLWDAASGEKLRIFKGHKGYVVSVSFSADGRKIVSAGSDRTIRLWRLEYSPAELAAFKRRLERKVEPVSSDAEGQKAEERFKLPPERLFDGANPLPPLGTDRALLDHNRVRAELKIERLTCCWSLSPDTSLIATGDEKGNIQLWDIKTKKSLRTLKGCGRPSSTSFSPDGSKLLAACRDQTLLVWDVRNGRRIRMIKDVYDLYYPGHAWFTPDGKNIVLASQLHRVYMYPVSGRNHEGNLVMDQPKTPFSHLAVSRYGDKAIVATQGGFVYLQDLRSGASRRLLEISNPIFTVLISEDGSTASVTHHNGKTLIFDVATARKRRTIWVRDHLGSPVLNRDGSKFAVDIADNKIAVFDTRSGKKLHTLLTDDGMSPDAFSKDDSMLLAYGNRSLQLLKIAWTPQELEELAPLVKEGAPPAEPAGPEDGETAEQRFKLPFDGDALEKP